MPRQANLGTAESRTSSLSMSHAPSSSGKRGFWNMLRTSTDAGSAQNSSTSPAPTSSPSTDFRPKLANSLSNSLSSFAAGLSAPGWAVRRDSNDPPAERKRLPRRHIDEAQLAEDVMRFADARHVLRTENDAGKLRELGIRLEEGWRKKVRTSRASVTQDSSLTSFRAFFSAFGSARITQSDRGDTRRSGGLTGRERASSNSAGYAQ